MSAFFNTGSLILGLLAWIIPFIAIKRPPKKDNWTAFSPLSFGCCGAALILQLFEIRHRVQIQDWSAILDTIGAIVWVSVILLAFTILLNIFALALVNPANQAVQNKK